MPILLAPQAALETAAVTGIIGSTPAINPKTGTAFPSYTAKNVKRMFDERPGPLVANVFVSVWSDNVRKNNPGRMQFDEEFHFSVTITIRTPVEHFDVWVHFRDELEARANAIRKTLGLDALDYVHTRAANTLAGYTMSVQDPDKPVGFVEAFGFLDMGPIQSCNLQHFQADLDEPPKIDVGLRQTLNFGKSRRIQRFGSTAT